MKYIRYILLLNIFVVGNVLAEPVFMSSEWAVEACKAWNADVTLTKELKKSGWVENDNNRGYKVMQIYRSDCTDSPRVEMQIAEKNDQATCIYGGWAKSEKLDSSIDYVMHAKDKHWLRMGDGRDGPMKAMMLFRLRFQGPYGEAMGNMGPFKSFLLLTGKVASDRSSCPKKK